MALDLRKSDVSKSRHVQKYTRHVELMELLMQKICDYIYTYY